jgi:ABC-type transporter Mla subunit MlaD
MNIFRQEIRTGLLVVVTISVLVTVMLYLGSPGVFIPQKTYILYVDNAGGLKPGADVALAGRKIGQVMSLHSPVPEAERPDPKKEIKVVIKVNRSAQIYQKTKCYITSASMLSEFYVDFTEGEEASGVAPEWSTFNAERPPGLDKAVPMVLDAIQPALKAANDTMTSLQKTSDNLARLTAEGGEVERTVQEFRKFATNLEELSSKTGPLHLTLENVASLTGPDGKIQLALGNIEVMTKPGSSLDQTLKNAQRFTGNLADNKDLEQTLKNAKTATQELNATIAELRGKLGSVAGNLDQATDTLKRQPWRLIWPSTKKYGDEEKHGKPAPSPTPREHTASRREREHLVSPRRD